MNETTITRSSLPPPSQAATNAATRASAQTNRIAALAHPNAALQDLQEEVSFAFSERLEKRNAEQEKAHERSQKLLKVLLEKIQKGHIVDDKIREPLEHKIEQKMQSFSKHEQGGAAWQDLMDLSTDKAALLATLEALKQKSTARGDDASAHRYALAAESCALTFESHIRTAINIGTETRVFAAEHNLPAEKILDAYQSAVADYSGILRAALDLTEKLGLEKSEAGAAFIRQNAGKEIAMLEPSVSPEQLLHVLAELKGLQVLATVKEQVAQHRESMARSEKAEARSEKTEASAEENTTTRKIATSSSSRSNAVRAGAGIADLSDESLVKGVFHSAVAPQSFVERLDLPASRAYTDKPSGLVMHFQGLHRIFKGLPEYAFAGRIDKQRALLPLETRLDALVAREREAVA